MKVSSLLTIFDTLLETAVVARAQFLMSRSVRDLDGMLEAIETSLAVDQDLIAILEEEPFAPLGLSGTERFPGLPGTPEEIIELMRTLKRLQSVSLADQLKTIPGDIPELEERRAEITNRKMDALGKFFRRAKRILQEQWDCWNSSYEREFRSMLNLRAPRKRR